MKNLLASVAILASLSGTAVADQITWDAGYGASESAGSQYPVTELVFAYNSQSLVTDSDGNGFISNGDTITSFGGYGANGFDMLASSLQGQGHDSVNFNNVGSFSPNPIPGFVGYGSDYIFTFFFNDLMGTFQNTDFVYTSGTLQFGLVSFNMANTGLANGFHHLFDLNVNTGGPENVAGQSKQVFEGFVDNFANNAGSDFSLDHEGKNKTLSEWASLGDINWSSNQTVSAGFVGFPSVPTDVTYDMAGGTAVIAANHTGRMSLTVPEPTTLAILGLGLLGMAGASRRKAK